MAKTIKGVSPEREAYMKGQQERGVTVRNGVSPQRQAYMDSIPNDEVIEAKPVNANRTNMMQRPLTSRIPRIGSNPLDINQIRGVASDMVNNGNYQHPEYKAKLQAMFPKPKLALGGIVNANQSMWNESYKQRPDMFHDNLSFDNMTTDGTDNASPLASKQTKPMSIMNALALKENRASSGFENMTTDGYKKGGVVKKSTETNRQRLGAINYKEGGTIKGPGTGTSDSIDANLPVGSAIIPASVLKLYGEDFFDKLEAIANSPDDNEESAESISHTSLVKPTLGMKCGGVAKMKDGGIALQVNPTPKIQGMKAGMPDYGYGDRYEEPNSKTIVRPKAQGYFGEVQRPDGKGISGELSVNTGRGEVPSMTPNMTRKEIETIVTTPEGKQFPNKIYDKAQQHADFRQLQGQSPFAGINDKTVLLPSDNEKMIGDMTSNVSPLPGSKGLKAFAKGGIVPAKVSNGERYLTPEAVKFFGQKFVNTLIHAEPDDVKEEMGEVKGGKVHAARGFVDPEAQARINKMTGVDRTPVNIKPMSKAAVDMTAVEHARPNINGITPSTIKFGQGPFDPNLVHDERAQTLSERRNELNKSNRAKQVAFADNAGGIKQLGGGALTQLPAAEIVKQSQASPLVQKGFGEAQTKINQQYRRKLPILPGTMNDQTESVVNKAGELMNTKWSDLADKGKRYVNTNYPNAISGVQNAGNRIVDDFKLGIKGIGSNMLGANSTQPTAQVKNAALSTTANQPAVSSQPVANMPFISLPIGDNAQSPKIGVAPQPKQMANSTTEAPINAPIGVTQTAQPYSTRLGNMGDKVNTLNIAGKGQMQFADGRTLMPEQVSGLQDTINRNADPAFQSRLAEQAQIVNDRMAWAKQNDLERNARLGNKAAADTLKAQADTQQAQLAAQVEANKLGYNKEADAAKLAQEKELKGRELDIQENKPIVTDIRNPEGIVTGQNVLGRTKDKEGKVSYNNLAQNATDKDAEVMQSLSPEERTDMYNNSILTLQDKKLKPTDPKYKASINFLRLHDLLFPQPAA